MEMTREAIEALLAQIAADDAAETLSDDDVATAEADLLAAFDAVRAGDVEGVDPTDVTLLSSIADSVDNLRALAALRIDEAERTAAEVEALAARLAATEDGADVEPEAADDTVEPEAATDSEPEAEAEAVDTEPVAEAEPVAAAARRPALRSLRARTPEPAPPAASTAPVIRGTRNGEQFQTMADVAAAMADRWNDLGGTRPGHTEKIRVARIPGLYSEDRVLDGTDDLARIEAVTAADAIVASGGFCAPAQVNYDLITVGVTSRPVRDALARFQATRGAVQLPAPPTLASIDVAGADAAVSQWTNTEDEAGESTKPIQVIDCASFTEYETYAVTKRLRFGNFGARAFPEQVSAWNDLTMVAHARLAEGLLLDALKTNSTAVTQAQVLGAARDLAETMIRAAVAWRSRHRAPDARLRVLVPWWVPLFGAVDLFRGTDDGDVLRDAQGAFAALVANAGVNVTYYIDTPSTGDSQVFGAQGAGALGAWPATVQWGMFDEGHFLFLDGGNLDLGIVRDSTLNETNDFETFAETFEGLGKHGVEALWVTSTVCPNGEYQAPIDASITCGS